jgi:hypothetical protein
LLQARPRLCKSFLADSARHVIVHHRLHIPLELLQGQRELGLSLMHRTEQRHLGEVVAGMVVPFPEEHHVVILQRIGKLIDVEHG